MAQSHLGQPLTKHVTLELVGGGSGPQFRRNLPGGGSEMLQIPDGHALVVTDVDWQYATVNQFVASRIQTLRLFIETPNGDKWRAFESTITLIDTGGNPGFAGGASEAMTAGFVVSSKAKISLDVWPGPFGQPGGLQHLLLRGYVASLS